MFKNYIIAEKNKYSEKIDYVFLLLVVLMCGIGFVALYSGSSGFALRIFDNSLYFIKRQFIFLLIGLVLFIITATINIEKALKYLPFLLIGTIVLLIVPFIPGIGLARNGATRWIKIGKTTFQPSELAKLTLIVFLSNIFSKNKEIFHEQTKFLYKALAIAALFAIIIYLQNDFSTAIFILVIAFLMFFMAGVKIRYFFYFIATFLPFLGIMILSKEYRIKRVLSYLHPNSDPLGAGYQVNAAMQTLTASGFWGRGLGNGIRKIASIPEVQSDFIFVAWAEEMGFIGVALYFFLLFFLVFRAYKISFRAPTFFYSLLGFGCTTVLFLQSIVNCGVIVRLFPATGIPLPFFSSGGSSLIITMILCGVLLNISRLKNMGEIQNDY